MESFFCFAVRRGPVRLKMAAAVTEELVKDREFGVLYLESKSWTLFIWENTPVTLVF